MYSPLFGNSRTSKNKFKLSSKLENSLLILSIKNTSLVLHFIKSDRVIFLKSINLATLFSTSLSETKSISFIASTLFSWIISLIEIVNEVDIVNALKYNNHYFGKLAGYATDVIENEFDDITKSPIIRVMNEGNNIIVTPHIGGMTIEGQTKAYEWSINKLW